VTYKQLAIATNPNEPHYERRTLFYCVRRRFLFLKYFKYVI